MKRKHLLQFFWGIAILLIVNVLANQYFLRWDLTEEGRYSISPATKNILQNLDQEVYIKVYLEGDFPPGFKRLQKTVQETLDEFKIYGGTKLKFRFIDPSLQGKDAKDQQNFYKELVQKGIQPTNLFAKEGDKKVEKLVFPGALLYYKDYEVPVMLFKTIDQRVLGQSAPSPEQILNQSVENVEYNLISAIRQLTQKNRKRVGFIEGHGELDDLEKDDIVKELQKYYDVFKIDLPKSELIEGVDAVIMAKPDSAISEADKYKIDQFIMRGGRALFFLDVVGVYMDSVLRDKGSFTFPIEHNMLDMMFKFGVRINANLVKDLNSGVIPMVVGNMGNQQQIKPIPWQYYPLLNTFNRHPIVKNLGAVQTKFISSIDTVKAAGIRKTPLVFSSKYAKVAATPLLVSFNEARKQPNPQEYNQGPLPVAYLLEGEFNSTFKSRSMSKDFVAKSKPTKIIVCSDGDVLRNDISRKTGKAIPLGFDAVFQTTFSNKDFIVNAVDYLIDDQGVISARTKEVTLRPLDKLKLQNERTFWQAFNMAAPLVFILIFGLLFSFLRKRAYGK
jgi:gliding-associated putative ABC transporter substrate-binding component GldG